MLKGVFSLDLPKSYFDEEIDYKLNWNNENRRKELNTKLEKYLDEIFIKGKVVSSLIKQKKDVSKYIDQLRAFLPILYKSNTNIDYYPTNFVVNAINDLIYYIDYECNAYDSKWDFDNRGIKYWNGEEALN